MSVQTAALFNGSNSHLAITNISGNQTTFSVSVWFQLATSQTAKTFFSNLLSTPKGWSVGISDSSANQLKFYLVSGTVTSATVLTSGVWYHAIFTYDGTTAKIYLNGNTTPNASSALATQYTTLPVNNYVGSSDGTTQFLNGKMAALGYWNKALSTAEVTSLYNSGSGLAFADLSGSLLTSLLSYLDFLDPNALGTDSVTPNQYGPNEVLRTFGPAYLPSSTYSATILAESSLVSYWKLGEANSTTATDSKGSNNGTYTGNALSLSEQPVGGSGVGGACLGINLATNNTSYVNIPAFSLASPITIELWFRVNQSFSTQNSYLVVKNPALAQWGISYNSGVISLFGGSGTTITSPANTQLYDGTWHYVMATISGTTGTIFLDGDQVATGSVTAIANGTTNSTNDINIGRSAGGAYFNGYIDEVALYNTALTLSDAQAHYAAGVGARIMVSGATGNFSSASTWRFISQLSYTEGILNNGLYTLTTSYTNTSTFTPGAITIDGIGLKVYDRNNTTGTLIVALDQAGSDVSGTVVTVNLTDLPITTNGSFSGWFFFKFSSPVTLSAATAYSIKFKVTGTTSVRLFATSSNASTVSRFLRTTATARAPISGDSLIIVGELTGAGASNAFTVTMDNTDYTLLFNMISVNRYASLVCETSASTNYYLRLLNYIFAYSGGTISMGTSGTRIPSNSHALLEITPGSNASSGIEINSDGTINAFGNHRSSYRTTITSNAALGATTLTLADTTGFAAGDTLAIGATGTTATQNETKTILSVDSSTQVTLTAGLLYPHSNVGEVMIINRNVAIRSLNYTIRTYVNLVDYTSTCNIQDVEFSHLGANALNKYGIYCVSGGTISYCSMHDFADPWSQALYYSVISSTGTFTYSYNNIYNCSNGVYMGATYAFITTTVSNNWFVGCVNPGTGRGFIDMGGSTFANFSGNRFVGCQSGAASMRFFNGNSNFNFPPNSVDDLYFRSNSGTSLEISVSSWLHTSINTLNNFTSFYTGVGIRFVTSANYNNTSIIFTNAVMHDLRALSIESNFIGNLIFRDSTFANLGTVNEYLVYAPAYVNKLRLENSTFTGWRTDFVNAPTPIILEIDNCSTNVTPNMGGAAIGSSLSYERYNQVAGDNRYYTPSFATVVSDTSITHSGTYSIKISPGSSNSLGASLPWNTTYGHFYVAGVSGGTVSASIYVRISSTSNASAVYLVVKPCPAAGIYAETIIATANLATTNSWQQISGTTITLADNCILEFAVKVVNTVAVSSNGTGQINIDDFAASSTGDTSTMDFTLGGQPISLIAAGNSNTIALTQSVVINRSRKYG